MTTQNAFHWRGKPSIFTTGEGQQDFTGANHGRSLEMSARNRPAPVMLSGSSVSQRPAPLDLRSNRTKEKSK